MTSQTAREWVSIEDPEEDRQWMFDVTFLTSRWTCIFGNGCQGVLTAPAPELVQGCCSYGAHFTDEEDVARVTAAAKTLTAEQWQFKDKGARGIIKRDKTTGDITSRLVDDACIFLNRPGFAKGAGCAFHVAAMERGIPHAELKPDVCWQLPLRRYDEAAGYFETAAALMESDFTAASFIVQCHEVMNDKEGTQLAAARAMKRIEKIVSEDPGHGRAIGFGVSILVTLGQKERAREWAKRARLIDPDNANLQYNLACAMSLAGDHDEALTILRGVADRSSPGMLSWIESDSDLDAIRPHPHYVEIIESARRRIAQKAAAQQAA